MVLSLRKIGFTVGTLLGPLCLLAAQGTARSAPSTSKAPKAKLVDVNTASKAALMKLPGIDGPLADKIIAGRPYLSKAKLVTQKVLPVDAWQKLRGLIVAGAPLPAKP